MVLQPECAGCKQSVLKHRPNDGDNVQIHENADCNDDEDDDGDVDNNDDKIGMLVVVNTVRKNHTLECDNKYR